MSIYTMDFDTMLYRLKDLEKSYNAELKLLESHAPGCLYGVKRDGRQNYLQTQIINGKQQRHGITNDPDTLRRLCRKAYLREALESIRENINCITTVKLQCTSLQPAEIAAKVKPWIEEPYVQSTFMPEKKVHITSRGEKMRSKNEVLHAETMYRLGIPFRYEPVLHIGDRELIPDFSAMRIRDAKIFYAEHCGMPDNKEYMEHHKWKMKVYEAAGIVPWDNLIVTYGDVHGNVDVRIIESELRSKLL